MLAMARRSAFWTEVHARSAASTKLATSATRLHRSSRARRRGHPGRREVGWSEPRRRHGRRASRFLLERGRSGADRRAAPVRRARAGRRPPPTAPASSTAAMSATGTRRAASPGSACRCCPEPSRFRFPAPICQRVAAPYHAFPLLKRARCRRRACQLQRRTSRPSVVPARDRAGRRSTSARSASPGIIAAQQCLAEVGCS